MRTILSFIIHTCTLCTVIGQDYFTTVQQYTVQDGLTDNYVVDIFQDSKGYIWIPSQTGMNRFDGHEIISYTKDSHDLPTNDFEAVHEDRVQRLWFVSKGAWNTKGLSYYQKQITIYNPEDQSFLSFKQAYNLPFEEEDMIWITHDHMLNIWISTKSGKIYKCDEKKINLIFEKSVSDSWLGRYAVSTGGKIGILESDKVTITDSTGAVLYEVDLPYDNNLIYAGLSDELWVYNTRSHLEDGGQLRVWHMDHDRQVAKPFFFKYSDGSPFNISKDEIIYTAFKMDLKGRYWAFIEEQFLIFNHDGVMIADLTNILEQYKIPSESILYNFAKENFAWLATEKRCFSVALRNRKFHTLLPDTDYGIAGSIVQDRDGSILVAQDKIIKIDSNGVISGELPLFNVSVSYEDELGDLWFADELNGIHKYNYISNSTETVIEPNQAIGSLRESLFVRRFIRCIFHDIKTGNLLIGTRAGGLLNVDLHSKDVLPFDRYNEFDDLKNQVVNHFYKNDEGLWLCTTGGLYLLDNDAGIIAHYKLGRTEKTFSELHHLHEDSDGVFWIATNGEGLIKWDRKNEEIEFFSKSNGLSHNRIYAVYEDQYNRLWMPSGYGLMQLDKASNTVHIWTNTDGLPFDEFASHFHFQSRDGRIFLGGANGGVVAFNPFDIEPSTKNIIITDFLNLDPTNGIYKSVHTGGRNGTDLVIQPNVISSLIKVSNTDYTNPQNTIYKYRYVTTASREEASESWILQEDNQIRITGLSYGEHVIEIEATGTDDLRTKGTLALTLFVLKPFYKKPWFLLLFALISVGAITLIFKWRTYQLQKDKMRLEKEVSNRTQIIVEQKKELERSVATKDRLFAIIGHDLRGPLFGLQGVDQQIDYLFQSGQIDRLKKIGKSIGKTTKYLSDILENLLTWSMHQMGKLPYDPEIIKLKEVTEDVYGLFENNAKAKEVTLKMEVPSEIEVFVDKNAIGTILRNLVSNAIKFTPESGAITVSASSNEEGVLIHVKDTGMGLSSQQASQIMAGLDVTRRDGTAGEKSTGLGLSLCRELVYQNKGAMAVEAKINEGTTFVLLLPAEKPTD